MTLSVNHLHGSVGELHGLEIPSATHRELWVMHPNDRAVVLGSSQDAADLAAGVTSEHGWQVVRRRSGGGAVLVDQHSLWMDLIVPRGDPQWSDDVSRSFWWLGDLLAGVLRSFGIDADVYRGAYVRTPASTMVCFAGLGSGEVVIGGQKIVGLSQRRTRDAARFQLAILRRWRSEAWDGVLASADPAIRQQIVDSATGLDDLGLVAPSNDEILNVLTERLADSD